MKSKFSEILKLKKEKISEVERSILEEQNKKSTLLQKNRDLETEISNVDQPLSGNFSQIQLMKFHVTNFKRAIEYNLNKISLIEDNILRLNQLYKERKIDFEKINYLHKEEIAKHAKAIALRESKDLDEIANILFLKKNKGK
jgi:hypothetical protein